MADVTIASAASAAQARAFRTMWFDTASVGFKFFIDGDGDLKVKPSTDGGATWGTAVEVDDDTDITCIALDTWWDKATMGDYGNKIHIVWIDADSNSVKYRWFDTGGFFGPQVTVFSGVSAVAGYGTFVTITKGRGDGMLGCAFCIDAGAETGFSTSKDGGATWSARANPYEAFPDIILLAPGLETDPNDLMVGYLDNDVGEATFKLFDDSANSFTETPGSTIVVPNTTDGVGQYGFSIATRLMDGHLFLGKNREYDTVNGDFHCYDAWGVDAGELVLKAFVADNVDDLYHTHIFIDPYKQEIYATYIGKNDGTETLGTSVNVYYRKSIDSGLSWGPEVKVSDAAGNYAQLYGPLTGPRYIVSWRDRTTGDILTNAVNSVAMTPLDEITIVGAAGRAESNGADATMNLPAMREGDLLIVPYAIGDNDSVDFNMAMVTAGFTEIADLHADDVRDCDLGVFYKVMGPSPDVQATVDGLGGADAAVVAGAFAVRGADPVTPLDVTATTATGINTMHPNPPSLSGFTRPGVWSVIVGAGAHANGTIPEATFPSGYQPGWGALGANDTTDITICLGYKIGPSDPEDPGVITIAGTDSADYAWCAVHLAIRPKQRVPALAMAPMMSAA